MASNLFALQTRAGLWADAETTLARSVRNTLVEAAEGRRRRAVLAYQRSLEAGKRERGAEALKRVRAAHDLDPGFIPAAVRLARLLIGAGRARKAAAVIEDTWSRAPHADLLDAYWAARGAADGLEKVHAAERLAKFNPDHVESHLALAAAALEAPLWGEARKHLEAAGGTDPSARVCRLMAALEESEHENMERAHEWLTRAPVAGAGTVPASTRFDFPLAFGPVTTYMPGAIERSRCRNVRTLTSVRRSRYIILQACGPSLPVGRGRRRVPQNVRALRRPALRVLVGRRFGGHKLQTEPRTADIVRRIRVQGQRIVDPDPASLQLREAPRHCQPEPRTGHLRYTVALHAIEGVEDRAAIHGIDPGTRVLHFHVHVAVLARAAHRHKPAIGGEPMRV